MTAPVCEHGEDAAPPGGVTYATAASGAAGQPAIALASRPAIASQYRRPMVWMRDAIALRSGYCMIGASAAPIRSPCAGSIIRPRTSLNRPCTPETMYCHR